LQVPHQNNLHGRKSSHFIRSLAARKNLPANYGHRRHDDGNNRQLAASVSLNYLANNAWLAGAD
jgi:hypothetical protein